MTEVLDTERRETLGSSLAIAISVGITLIYALGALLHWIIVAWIFIGFIVIQCIGLHFVPESPHWLMSQGFEEEAQQGPFIYYVSIILDYFLTHPLYGVKSA